MIDNIKCTFDVLKINKDKFTEIKYSNKNTGESECRYETRINNIWVGYYPKSKKLVLSGRYIQLIINSYIKNFDDLFLDKEDLDKFFDEFNNEITKAIDMIVDIKKFKPTRIDFCINVKTPYVNEYIKLFNYCFKKKNSKYHKNFIYEQGKEAYTSCYIKTKQQYENSENENFTVNFYNKQDQLLYKQEKDKEKYGRSGITNTDIDEAKDILRLEMQAHYKYLKDVSKMFKINFSTRKLTDYFNIEISKEAIKKKIKFFFGEEDFYSYKAIKQILLNNGYKNHDILTYIKKLNNNEILSAYEKRKYSKILVNLGINAKYFIPKSLGIDYLMNPIKLIDEKIKTNKLADLKYE